VREPTQVFTLLECLYGSFDTVAKRRGVFKVETIGDSYVAVVGLPKSRKNHAMIMVRFAADCRERASTLLNQLETTLGPGTNALAFRFGLNSGPTTAGVLRGEKGRFQLFGDTVNTAARMESNGRRNHIHVTQKTADLLIAAGKGHWVQAREDAIEAKGKGKMQTYWVNPTTADQMTATNSSGGLDLFSDGGSESSEGGKLEAELQRMIDFHVETLKGILLQLVSQRGAKGKTSTTPLAPKQTMFCPREEAAAVISLPNYHQRSEWALGGESAKAPKLDRRVKSQLSSFVSEIAHMYHSNPFHNFEHATHVAMATRKLLTRVLSPKQQRGEARDTYGKMCDPLMQFALIFAALIHDVGTWAFASMLYVSNVFQLPNLVTHSFSIVNCLNLQNILACPMAS